MATIDGEGFITRGTKLGVQIGVAEPEAKQILLKQGLLFVGVVRGGNCFPRTFPADHTVHLVDLTWRKGELCLGVTAGRVSQIGWHYNFMQP